MTRKIKPCTECRAQGRQPHASNCRRGKRLSAAARKGAQARSSGGNISSRRKQTRLRNEFIFVVDRSASMISQWNGVKENLRNQVQEIIDEASAANQDAFVSFYSLGSHAERHYLSVPAREAGIPELYPGGMTALRDGIGMAVDDQRPGHNDDPNTSYLLYVISDGGENFSSNYSHPHLVNLVNKVGRTNNWSFAITGPLGCRSSMIELGFTSGDIQEWDTYRDVGGHQISWNNSIGTRSYFEARSLGATQVNNFYADTTGKERDISRMTDVSQDFRRWEVNNGPVQIREFVEKQIGRGRYRKGNAFYELKKSETVQASKDIVIMHNKTGAMYGNQEGRQVLGLPERQQIKLRPGDHDGYTIFVQSTSVNRKCSPGDVVVYQNK